MKMIRKASLATQSIFFICGLALSAWAPMIPYIKDKLTLNDADLGLVLLIFGLGALIIMPITGMLVNKYSSRNVSTYASYSLCICLSLLSMAQDVYSLSTILFFFGVSLGSINVAINAHGIAVEALAKKPLMSGFHCLFSVGGLVGASFMSVLLKFGFELSTSAITVSAIILIILLFQSKHLLKQKIDIKTSEAKEPFTWPEQRILYLGIFCFILFLSEGAMLDWSAVLLNARNHYDETIAGIGYAVFSIAMAIGRGIGDKFIEYFGRLAVIQWGSLIAATGLFTVLSVDWHYLELIGFFLIGIGASNIVPLIFSAAGSNTTSSYSLTIVTTFGYTGILLGPAFIGFIAEMTSLTFALACVVALLFFVGLTARSNKFKEIVKSPT